MKITSFFFDELSEYQRIKVITQAEVNGVKIDYLEEHYVPALVNAEVIVDDNFLLYDLRILDPYHYVQSEGNVPLYIHPDGWSNWLFSNRDNAGNDVATILRDYDGELQDNLNDKCRLKNNENDESRE